jgi:plastocyanin
VRRRARSLVATAGLVLAVSLASSACTDDGATGGIGQGPALPTSDATDAAGDDLTEATGWSDLITIEDRRYTPADFFVAPERELRVVNRDDEAHTVTAFDGSFDVRVPPGGEVEFLTPEPGAYSYACRFHPEMGAEFEVR